MALFKQLVLNNEIEERLEWLIKLRWFAIAGVMLVILSTRFILKFDIQLFPLLTGVAILLIYNFFCGFCIKQIHSGRDNPDWFKKATRFGNIQISVDLTLLAYLIHFSGGVENPFIFFFIFHMVIGSILLSNLAAFLQATYASTLLWGLYWLVSSGTVRHFHLVGFLPPNICPYDSNYLSGLLAVFTLTLFLIVFMATSIVNRMRDGERELAIANEKLAKQDKIKSQYVLKVSHDMQSSLSTIQSLMDNIIQGYTGPVSDESLDMANRAEKRTVSLLRFVKELLDLSQMRAVDEIEKKPCNLSQHVRSTVEQLQVLANNKNQTIEQSVESDATVLANPTALDELIENLVGNAIRYTPDSGQIKIKQQDSENSFIQIAISDTGIGIPEESLPHIFEDFYRANNAKGHDKNGTGLGMSIVKQIVEGHNGKIWIDSEVGKGTTFTFTLQRVKT
ncbi:hypothetical protein HQ585_08480 [candidate division KSB1 bacterium]|nr:hypothetical protein [candidate division KSB1 bacterium]